MLVKIVLACAMAFAIAQATSYVYLDNSIKLDVKKAGVSLYNGSPIEVIAKKGKDKVLVKVTDF